jgi:hypothetical protein
MDPQTLTAATALFLTIIVVFYGAIALLTFYFITSLPGWLVRKMRPDSRIHAGEESR